MLINVEMQKNAAPLGGIGEVWRAFLQWQSFRQFETDSKKYRSVYVSVIV